MMVIIPFPLERGGYPRNLNSLSANSVTEWEAMAEGEEGHSKSIGDEIRKDQEEALLSLLELRNKDVLNLRQRVSYYTSQLDQAEKNLEETQQKLARHRGQVNVAAASTSSQGNDLNPVKVERRSMSPVQISGDSSESALDCKPQPDNIVPLSKSSALDKKRENPFQKNNDNSRKPPQAKPPLVIPAAKPKIYQTSNVAESSRVPHGSDSCVGGSGFTFRNSIVRLKPDKSVKSASDTGAAAIQSKGTKRMFEQRERIEKKERKELIQLIASSSSAREINFQTCNIINSQHNRKMRTVALCPTNDNLFASSALDGVVNLWQVQDSGSNAELLSSTDCFSRERRHWPEDIAWHPEGSSLFSVYRGDGGDAQISILNLYKGKENMRVHFLDEKPHVKGIINNIVFMPWEDDSFVTGGSDHAVVLWTDQDRVNSWKPKVLHRRDHSSSVMGVAGVQHKKVVMSAGADKRIFGFDLLAQRMDFKHQLESKCMSVLPNPRDVNLFMVQTGTLEKQLRLFDFRSRQTEIHAFGWKQESSESLSALINQSWSPDGLYITSGSVDPVIHIFDIRYNSRKPSQSIRTHQKRVFKAVWHPTLPLLISISSDMNIGFHKIV